MCRWQAGERARAERGGRRGGRGYEDRDMVRYGLYAIWGADGKAYTDIYAHSSTDVGADGTGSEIRSSSDVMDYNNQPVSQ